MATTPRPRPLQGGENPDHTLVREVLGEKTLQLSQLKKENASLRAEIEALRNRENVQGQTSSSTKCSTSSSAYEALAKKYNSICKLYRELDEKHERCESLIALTHKKFLETKAICRQWQAYHDYKTHQRQTRAQQLAEAEQPGPISPPSLPSDAPGLAVDEHDRTSDCDVTPKAMSGVNILPTESRILVDSHLSLGLAPDLPGGGERTSSKTLRVSSSQTTDSGSDPMTAQSSSPGKHEPSSDNEPVVVSARLLKRKGSASALSMPPPVRIKREENRPEQPIEIKSEDFSSPVQTPRTLVRTETSDLCAVAGPRVLPGQRALSEEIQGRHRSEPSRSGSMFTDDDMLDSPQLPQELDRSGSAPATDETDLPTANLDDAALRPLSVNVPGNGRLVTTKRPPPLKGRESDKVAAAKAALLSEDGDSQSVRTSPDHRGPIIPTKSPRTSKKRRLDSLLEEPTSESRERLVRSHSPESALRIQRQGLLTPVSSLVPKRRLRDEPPESARLTSASKASPEPSPGFRPSRLRVSRVPDKVAVTKEKTIPPTSATLPLSKPLSPTKLERQSLNAQPASATRPQSRSLSPTKRDRRPSNQPQGLSSPPPRPNPSDEPLRLRHLSGLGLEDFKINPATTGADFAFTDTVRGRARRCLPGCTSPSCCGGAALKAVQMGGYHGADDSDAEVLERHFGENWAAVIAAYPLDQRARLLDEARASAFANQYGRHRAGVARRSTPPGFWRTDMPSTQQVEEDRREAQGMVRRKVEERYREAMREGGRWMFRDE
ncbi:hypothetical protein LTR33_012394 [Friedmanniomyces endolithicus]|nr:hypothetical protein LTR33_012394 [Friedmanniomyces endolithicus]